MLFPPKRLNRVACCAVLAVLTACSSVPDRTIVSPQQPSKEVTECSGMSPGEAAQHGSTTGSAVLSSHLPTLSTVAAWAGSSTRTSGVRDVKAQRATCGVTIMPGRSEMAAMSAIGFAQDVERVNEAAFVLAAARVASARAAVRVELAPGGTQRRPTVSKSPTGHPGVFGSTPDAAAPLSSDGSYHSWPDWKLWHAVGLCEQRGTGQYDTDGDGIAWHGSPAGGSASSGYPGGLGLGRAFWDEFHTEAGVAQTNGALASPAEQIEVARVGSQNGTHMNGWSSWTSGCVQKTEASL